MRSAILRIAVVAGAAAATAVGATGAAGAATASSSGASGARTVTGVTGGYTSTSGGVIVVGVGTPVPGRPPVVCRTVPLPIDPLPLGKGHVGDQNKGQVKGKGTVLKGTVLKSTVVKGRLPGGPSEVVCIAPGKGRHSHCVVRVIKKGEIQITCTVNGHPQPGGPIILPGHPVSITSGTVSTRSTAGAHAVG